MKKNQKTIACLCGGRLRVVRGVETVFQLTCSKSRGSYWYRVGNIQCVTDEGEHCPRSMKAADKLLCGAVK